MKFVERRRRFSRIITAGLDMDFKGEPFEQTAQLLARADEITKLRDICVVCKGDASISHRMISSEERVLQSGSNIYGAMCRECHLANGGNLPV